jgi:hypothetical protein
MKNKAFTPAPIGISSGYNQLVWGFTLLELVVVILIIGDIRNLAIAYRLQYGSITGLLDADVGIGQASDQIPLFCRSSHYFWYTVGNGNAVDPVVYISAYRCSANGKAPQGPSGTNYLRLQVNLTTGADTWIQGGIGGY